GRNGCVEGTYEGARSPVRRCAARAADLLYDLHWPGDADAAAARHESGQLPRPAAALPRLPPDDPVADLCAGRDAGQCRHVRPLRSPPGPAPGQEALVVGVADRLRLLRHHRGRAGNRVHADTVRHPQRLHHEHDRCRHRRGPGPADHGRVPTACGPRPDRPRRQVDPSADLSSELASPALASSALASPPGGSSSRTSAIGLRFRRGHQQSTRLAYSRYSLPKRSCRSASSWGGMSQIHGSEPMTAEPTTSQEAVGRPNDTPCAMPAMAMGLGTEAEGPRVTRWWASCAGSGVPEPKFAIARADHTPMTLEKASTAKPVTTSRIGNL